MYPQDYAMGVNFATLRDGTNGMRLGHAVMDIRYRDGGYDAKVTAPMSQFTMLMEFNPLDVVLPAGHSLSIELTETVKTPPKHLCRHWIIRTGRNLWLAND